MNVQTIFRVGDFNPHAKNTFEASENVSYKGVEAVGQEAVNAIRKACPNEKIVLKGFEVNGKFLPVDLTTENVANFNPEKKIRLIKKN